MLIACQIFEFQYIKNMEVLREETGASMTFIVRNNFEE
jgi:hypothetical protein